MMIKESKHQEDITIITYLNLITESQNTGSKNLHK